MFTSGNSYGATHSSSSFPKSEDFTSKLVSQWTAIAPLAMGGLWLFKRYPKLTIAGLAVGAFLAYQANVAGMKDSVEGEVAHIH